MNISGSSLIHSALVVVSLVAAFLTVREHGRELGGSKSSVPEGIKHLVPGVTTYGSLEVGTSYGVELVGDWVTHVDLRGPDIIWQYWESVHPAEKDGVRGFACAMTTLENALASGDERASKRDSREAFFDSPGKCAEWLMQTRYEFLGASNSPSITATALADVLNLPQIAGRGWILDSVVHFAPQEIQRFLGARIMVVLSRSSGD